MKSHMISALLVACGLLIGTQALVAHHAGTMFSDEVKEIAGHGQGVPVHESAFVDPGAWWRRSLVSRRRSGAWSGAARTSWDATASGRPRSSPATKVTMRIRPMRDGSPAGGFVGAKFEDGKTVGNYK